MNKPWESDNCASMRAHYAVYSIPQAAALWCGVPEEQLDEILQKASKATGSGVARSIWKHPDVPCLEYRSRAIAEATENGQLPHGREDGKMVPSGDHVAYERRHVRGRDLRAWMEKAFPKEKPSFLFDDIEQNSHPSINVDSYRALKADRDQLRNRLEKARTEFINLRTEKNELESECDALKAKVEKLKVPGDRAESTYQNMIAALLDCIAGNLPDIDKHPSFKSEAKLIDAIDEHYRGYGGLSKSNLSRKFPEAKRALNSR